MRTKRGLGVCAQSPYILQSLLKQEETRVARIFGTRLRTALFLLPDRSRVTKRQPEKRVQRLAEEAPLPGMI